MWDTIEIVAAVLSLLTVGYGVGAWHERRRRGRESLVDTLNHVRNALGRVRFDELIATPSVIARGSQVTLRYTIDNRLESPIEIWLGADILVSAESYFYDVTQDKVVTLEPGRHSYERYLTLSQHVPLGRWAINGGIWFGAKSNPDQSFRLAVRHAEVAVE